MANYNYIKHSDIVTKSTVYPNHAVTIIGWDDTYSADNFKVKPGSDGAYIVLNSWGSTFGENGVYYISYEDLLIETQLRGVTSVSEISYEKLYQYDISEMYSDYSCKYAANVFTAEDDESLTEVMIGSWNNQTCDIYVNPKNDNLRLSGLTKVASGVNLKPGYNTIVLDSAINLTAGNKFAVAIKFTNSGYTGVGAEENVTGTFSNVVSHPGESFTSSNGVAWHDVYDESNMCNLSIKAFTQKKADWIDVSQIKGQIEEEVGGTCSLEVQVSHEKSNEPIDVKITKKNVDVTEQFQITGNQVRGNGAYIKLIAPNTIKKGTYVVNITIDGFDTVQRELIVSGDSVEEVTISGVLSYITQADLYSGTIAVYQIADENGPFDILKSSTSIETHDVDEDGNYELTLEPGIYNIVLAKPGFLKCRIENIDLTDGTNKQLEEVRLIPGDVVDTGEIEVDDLVAMNENIGKTITDTNKRFDLNEDGTIDEEDRNLLKANYGEEMQVIEWE